MALITRRCDGCCCPTRSGSRRACCGQVMRAGDELDLDHNDDGNGYLGFSHARCNRQAGGRLGRARRKGRTLVAEVVIGIEVSQDRAHTSVVSCGAMADGALLVNLTNYLDGTSGVARAVGELEPVAVVIDRRSPAVNLVAELEDAGYTLMLATRPDIETAHARFLDGLVGGTVKFTGRPELDLAVRGAEERSTMARPYCDDALVDAGPLIAAELALWAFGARPREIVPFIMWGN